jgi:cytochrome c-type biogenesis protein CcmH/NrfF
MSVRPLALLAAAALGAAAPVSAQGVDTGRAQDVARAAEEQLRSPVTPSHTLDMCPSAEAQALRDTVFAMAVAGMSSPRIVERVIATRGEQMRIVPRQSGAGLWAWVLPPLVLVAGTVVVVLGLMRLRRGRAGVPEAPAEVLSDDERARVDAALRQFERGEAIP